MITFAQATEIGDFKFVSEASTLQWKPGELPPNIRTDMGNKQPFTLMHVNASDDCSGGWESAVFKQAFGCLVLKVFND